VRLPREAIVVASIRYHSGIVAMSDNGLPLPGASFTIFDFGATLPIRSDVSLQGGVKNAFDADYYYWEGFPEPGRSAYLTLRYAF
jgi:iron complex outermembrane receptor protein